MITTNEMEKILNSEKVIEIDNKIDSLKDKINKYYIKIEKINYKIKKIKNELEETNNQDKKLLLNFDINFGEEDIIDINCKIKEIENKIEQLNIKRNSVIENIQKEIALTSVKIDIITEFLDNWAYKYTEFLNRNKAEFEKIRNDYDKEIKKYEPESRNNDDKYREFLKISKELRSKYNEIIKNNIDSFVVKYYYLKQDKWDTEVYNYVKEERDTKEKIFYYRIKDLAGDIIDAELNIGENGEINGIVTGTKNKVSVITISAGGYNIQRFHFRVLVKILK